MPNIDAIMGEGPRPMDHSTEVWFWNLSMWSNVGAVIDGQPEITIMSASGYNPNDSWEIMPNSDLALEIKITGHRPRIGDILRLSWGERPDDSRTDWIVRSVHRANDPNAEETNRRWRDECDCVLLIGEDDLNERVNELEERWHREQIRAREWEDRYRRAIANLMSERSRDQRYGSEPPVVPYRAPQEQIDRTADIRRMLERLRLDDGLPPIPPVGPGSVIDV